MRVIYLYGFVPPDARLPDHGLLGVGEAAVELVPMVGFSAVVGRVPAREYAGEGLDAGAADVEWMAEQGLRHEQVVAWFVDHGTVVPSPLLTLFSSLDALRDAAGSRAAEVARDLTRFTGVREWDLKVGYQPDRFVAGLGELSPEVAALDREIADATPGKRYLLEKKRNDVARTELRATARRLAAELLDALRPEARDIVHVPQPPDAGRVVMNAALLVPTEREAAALRQVGDHRERYGPLGLEVAFTGPWAPYRFAGGADG